MKLLGAFPVINLVSEMYAASLDVGHSIYYENTRNSRNYKWYVGANKYMWHNGKRDQGILDIWIGC